MIQLPIEIGDTILTGKFRNKRVVVKEIGVDEHNLPTVNGRGILKIRIEKLMKPTVNKENKSTRLSPVVESKSLIDTLKNYDLYGWDTISKLADKTGYNLLSYRKGSPPDGGSPTVDAIKFLPKIHPDVKVKNVYEAVDGNIVIKTNTYYLKLWAGNCGGTKLATSESTNNHKKEIKESSTKIYNKFTDKFGNEYGFDNYMDFATFWFNLPIRKQKEYFPDNREQLQRAAANSKEARAKYTKIGEQSEVKGIFPPGVYAFGKMRTPDGMIVGRVVFNDYYKKYQVDVDGVIYGEFRDLKSAINDLRNAGFDNLKIKDVSNESKKIREQSEVNIGQSIPVKIKKDGNRFCIYRISQPDGEETKALNRDFGSKQEAERTAKLRGFVLVNDKGEPQEYEADKQPKSLKTTKEKVEYVLEVVRKTMRLHELDLTGSEVEAEFEEYADIIDKIDRLNAEVKKLEVRFKELDAKFVLMLETLEKELGNTKDTFIRAKNILITIKRRGKQDAVKHQYKDVFEWLYKRVSPQMRKLVDEFMEANKTVYSIKSSLGVQREGKINESWISDLYNKVKTFFVGIIAKLRNTNKTANSALDKLEQMV